RTYRSRLCPNPPGVRAGARAGSEVLTDAQGGITAVPGERSLEAYAEADPAKLRDVIGTLRDAYDVVLVDTGAGLSHETAVPLGLADGILLVTTPDDVSVTDTAKTVDLAERVDGTVIGVLVTRATRDTDVPATVGDLDVPVVGVVPVDAEATASEPLVLDAPDSDAADAYREVTAALQRVFFEGASGADLEPAVDGTERVEDKPEEKANEDEDDGGVFGGLFG
ncbi:MAG: septum site-determining protein MinD, partial [Halovenus sp.]